MIIWTLLILILPSKHKFNQDWQNIITSLMHVDSKELLDSSGNAEPLNYRLSCVEAAAAAMIFFIK